MTTHDQYADLVAGYAFDALDAAERGAFEAHLAGCKVCQAEVAELRRVSAGLGLASDPVPPPAFLRDRVLTRARQTEQSTQATQAGQAGQAGQARPDGTGKTRRDRQEQAGRAGRAGPGWKLLAAASVVFAAGMGLYALTLRNELAQTVALLTQASAQSNRLRAELAEARVDSARLSNTVNVLGAPDTLRVELRGQVGAPESLGHAFVSPTAGLIVSAQGLPALGPGQTYQLWVIPAGEGAVPIGAGTFDPDPAGRATFMAPVPAGVTGIATVAVTREPAGGSQTPTMPLFLAGSAAS